MDMSGSQKALKVISIIDIVFGILAIILSFMAIFMGGAVGIATSEIAGAELSAEEAAMAAGAMSIIGVLGLIMGLVTLAEGILGFRASNDPSKIMPVWILALIGMAGNAVSLIMTLVQRGNIISAILSLVISGLMLWIANNIKVQAGK